MADQIGEATVRITGDIKPLQQAVEKAENELDKLHSKGLQDFKINYMGESTFSNFEEYTEEIQRQTKAWEEYSQAQKSVNVSAQETSQSLSEVVQNAENATESVTTNIRTSSQESSGALATLKTALSDVSGTVEGFGTRLKEAFAAKLSTNTGIIAIATFIIGLLGKGVQSASKVDSALAESLNRIKQGFENMKVLIGRLVEPIITYIAPFIDKIGKVFEIISRPLARTAEIVGKIGEKLSGWLDPIIKAAEAVSWFFDRIADGINLLIDGQLDLGKSSSNVSDELNEVANAAAKAAQGYDDMQKSVAEANKALADANDEYQQSLKSILVNHEKTVQTLNDQIEDANKEYIKSVNERNQAFLVNQAKEEEAHQEKVDELMTQINFLQRYNNAYNKEKLEATKFALAREEALYKKRTEAERAELELQNQIDRQRRDERLASYEKELNDEKVFLNKHAAEFASVRDVILRDEVDNLRKRYNETVKTYNDQIAAAKSTYNTLYEEARRTYTKEAATYIALWKEALSKVTEEAKEKAKKMRDYGMGITPSGEVFVGSVVSSKYMGLITADQYASGGFTGRGGVDEVAGVVHRGEYVLPQDLVDQTTGTPKIGGNITINLSGTFATSEAEKRKVANQIVEALKQTNYARLGV